jgi:hypothetical protein
MFEETQYNAVVCFSCAEVVSTFRFTVEVANKIEPESQMEDGDGGVQLFRCA